MGKPRNRVTVELPKQLDDRVEELVEDGHFNNKSDALRTAIRWAFTDYDDPVWIEHRGRPEPLIAPDGGAED